MSNITIDQIVGCLNKSNIDYCYDGQRDLVFQTIHSLNDLHEGSVGFYRGDEFDILNNASKCGSLIVANINLKNTIKTAGNIIFVKNPSLAICLIGRLFEPARVSGIHPSALIHPAALIDISSTVAANAIIDGDVIIGRNTLIDEGVVIRNCIIGDNSHIYPGVKIGSSGLGSHRDDEGTWHHFPHLGKVEIGCNVIIQDNCVIARGTLNNTIVEDGVAIGPLTCIAHGVRIKKNAFIAQAVTIAGSVTVGESSIIWGNASIKDGINIGSNSIVGMGSVVLKDVPDNVTVAGIPAKKICRQ